MDDQIWDAAEFITEWDHGGLRYKAFEVPRTAIDEDCDEQSALLVIGIDSGNVRRAEAVFDSAFYRMDREAKETLKDILQHAPAAVSDFANTVGLYKYPRRCTERNVMKTGEYVIVAETKNGKLCPHNAQLFYRAGQYAQQVRLGNLRSDGALDIETDEQASKFMEEKNASQVTFIHRDDASDWIDNQYPDSSVMRAMILADWLSEIENEETGEITYSVAAQ